VRPIKPKKMPKTLEGHLRRSAEEGMGAAYNNREVRAILAALEYERLYGAEATRTLEDIGANGKEHTYLWAKAKARISLARLRRG
jgi:hypothetical protein